LDDWTGAKRCATPQDMADTLLYGYTGYLEYQATLARRELTESDLEKVKAQRQTILDKLC